MRQARTGAPRKCVASFGRNIAHRARAYVSRNVEQSSADNLAPGWVMPPRERCAAVCFRGPVATSASVFVLRCTEQRFHRGADGRRYEARVECGYCGLRRVHERGCLVALVAGEVQPPQRQAAKVCRKEILSTILSTCRRKLTTAGYFFKLLLFGCSAPRKICRW